MLTSIIFVGDYYNIYRGPNLGALVREWRVSFDTTLSAHTLTESLIGMEPAKDRLGVLQVYIKSVTGIEKAINLSKRAAHSVFQSGVNH